MIPYVAKHRSDRELVFSTLKAQKRNLDYLKTSFMGPTDLIVVWYSISQNNLLSNE
jgi:hypothetical protein